MMSEDRVGKKREREVMVIIGFPVNDGDVKRVLNIIQELAFLIKDSLHCKHLILLIEDVLAVLELVPMNPYHSMLLHRLAKIFGLAHESVGEGDNRHLNMNLNGIFFEMWAFV
ncbi:hypothetical protein AMTRI_Chr11g95240 [Amborella trichopoda]